MFPLFLFFIALTALPALGRSLDARPRSVTHAYSHSTPGHGPKATSGLHNNETHNRPYIPFRKFPLLHPGHGRNDTALNNTLAFNKTLASTPISRLSTAPTFSKAPVRQYSPVIPSTSSPSSYVPVQTPNIVYTPHGGSRDMSNPHKFISLDAQFDGNRTAVNLESTDGVAHIDCQKDMWNITVKDDGHYDVAKQFWTQGIALVSAICDHEPESSMIFVDRVEHRKPRTVMAYGQASPFQLGMQMPRAKAKFGTYKPEAKRALSSNSVERENLLQRNDDGATLEKRGFVDAMKSFGGGVASVVTNGASHVESAVTNAATHVESAVTNAETHVESAATNAATHFESLATKAATHVESLESKATSELDKIAHKTIATSVTGRVEFPKSLPTDVSPWGPNYPGDKLVTIDGIDVWDLGIHVSGGVSISGEVDFDATKLLGSDKAEFIKGFIDFEGKDWNLDFPLGLEFHDANYRKSFIRPIGVPIPLCGAEDICSFGLPGIFELGPYIQAAFNVTLDIKANGRISLGTNISYPNPHLRWNLHEANDKSNVGGWEGKKTPWFNVSDGSVSITGGIGFDLTQFNGLKFPALSKFPKFESVVPQPNINFTNSLGLDVTVTTGVKGNEHDRRDLSPRRYHARHLPTRSVHEHDADQSPRDMPARQLFQRDADKVCVDNGGTSVKIDIEEGILFGMELTDQIGSNINIWATQIPLYSHCIGEKTTKTSKTSKTHKIAEATGLAGNGTHKANATKTDTLSSIKTRLGHLPAETGSSNSSGLSVGGLNNTSEGGNNTSSQHGEIKKRFRAWENFPM
ncbi:MAG: hypothetical protein M1820_006909 [Bogoriella megaspora]|nr:MAG: hypothetical protein M1820_006909 [Bogoriella megaspora]